MAQLTPWIRQYTLRDLLDESFDLFKARFTTILLAAAIPFALVIIYVAVMRLYVFPGEFTVQLSSLIDDPEAVLEQFSFGTPFFVYTIGLSTVSGVVWLLAYIAQCRIAAWHALGEPVSLRAAYRLLAKPFWSLIVLLILFSIFQGVAATIAYIVGVIVGLLGGVAGWAMGADAGALAGVISGVIAFLLAMMISSFASVVFFLPAPVILAVDHTGPFAALGRSISYATANFKKLFYAILIYAHVPLVFAALISLLSLILVSWSKAASPMLSMTLGQVIGSLGTMVLWGLIACMQVLAYIDGRCRRENFDLLVLARSLGLGEEVERAFAGTLPAAAQTGYPDYALPLATGPVPAGQQPPAASGTMAYPDYSAPPPPKDDNQGGPDAN